MNKTEALRELYYLEANLAFFGGLYATDDDSLASHSHFSLDTKKDIETVEKLKAFISSIDIAPVEPTFGGCLKKALKKFLRDAAKKIDLRIVCKPDRHLHNG